MKNHMMDVAFEVISENDWDKLTIDELLKDIENRLRYLRQHSSEVEESCGYEGTYDF